MYTLPGSPKQQLLQIFNSFSCLKTADIVIQPDQTTINIRVGTYASTFESSVEPCINIGSVMDYCQSLSQQGVPMSNINAYAVDHYGVSYGYLLTLESMVIALSSFGSNAYSSFYGNCVSNL